jgi:hypothetical protein
MNDWKLERLSEQQINTNYAVSELQGEVGEIKIELAKLNDKILEFRALTNYCLNQIETFRNEIWQQQQEIWKLNSRRSDVIRKEQ